MNHKKSNSIFYVFIIPVILVLGIIICAAVTFFYSTTMVDEDGNTINTRWAKDLSVSFSQYVFEQDNDVNISEDGLCLLDNNHLWLQVIDNNGDEVKSYNKSSDIPTHYSPYDLVNAYQYGIGNGTVFIGQVENSLKTYIIGFPFKISKIITYVDTARYNSGKLPIVLVAATTLIAVLICGIIYVVVISNNLTKIQKALTQISHRKYVPVKNKRFLRGIYEGINELDRDILSADLVREKNEKSREEWITNITHDLKTPLAPIKGYAEILSSETESVPAKKANSYGDIIGKNVLYAEQLINDLKLTYQLKSGMIPIQKKLQNLSRFVKEIIIDILNNPECQKTEVNFIPQDSMIEYSFDDNLLKRAINNILINAIVHNDENVLIDVRIEINDSITIIISDNGRGMSKEESNKLFDRYYRGTSTKVKPEGTGLGMAIAKQIVELHDGFISVTSKLGEGTKIIIELPSTN